jgi:hypothetical protein
MRTLLFSALIWCCSTLGGHAARPPLAKPCFDIEREFVEMTLTALVRQGYLNERDLFTHRVPKPPGVIDLACAASHADDREPARTSNVQGGTSWTR